MNLPFHSSPAFRDAASRSKERMYRQMTGLIPTITSDPEGSFRASPASANAAVSAVGAWGDDHPWVVARRALEAVAAFSSEGRSAMVRVNDHGDEPGYFAELRCTTRVSSVIEHGTDLVFGQAIEGFVAGLHHALMESLEAPHSKMSVSAAFYEESDVDAAVASGHPVSVWAWDVEDAWLWPTSDFESLVLSDGVIAEQGRNLWEIPLRRLLRDAA